MLERLGLRLRVFLFFAALALGSLGAIASGLWLGWQRLGDPALSEAFIAAGLLSGFGVLGLSAWVWLMFDTHVSRAIEALAASIRAHAQSDLDSRLDAGRARYLGDLAPAAAAATDTLARTRNALAEAVARETTRLSAEKDRLETLLSDVPVGVLLCSASHQLVFYNGQAVDLLGAGLSPGLYRPVFDFLREGPVRHAYDRLLDAREPDAAADLLCATVGEVRMFAARMRLLAETDGTGRPGYVLTLRDVTADLAAHAQRERLLVEVFDRVRRPAANLQTVVGMLDGVPDMPVAPDLSAALREESAALVRAITELGARYDAERIDWWPLSWTRSADLTDGLRARLEDAGLSLEVSDPGLSLRCDAFELVALLAALASRIAAEERARVFRLAFVEETGPGASLVLCWDGAPLSVGRFDAWMAEPLDEGGLDVTGRAVLFNHGTEAWPERPEEGRAAIRLPLRDVRRAVRRPPPVPREVVYDFDLLSKARNDRVADARLEDLTYVVFDTETTGLNPARDEIVQLAAVRLVNGRRVKGEVFDTLVDPGRAIPAASTEVHGITDQMVEGAPPIAEVGARFHRFATDAVLIAHNAPFDMAFLRRHEGTIGAGFDNPVLDTVLLSAVLFGQQESHSLDALTARLGILIPEDARHTALGDTVATAEAFLKLLPMLRARGFETFGAVLAEVRRHGRLLNDLN